MNGRERDITRLNRMLQKERLQLPNEAIELLKSEVYSVFDSYFDVIKNSLELSVLPAGKGYEVIAKIKADNVKKLRVTI